MLTSNPDVRTQYSLTRRKPDPRPSHMHARGRASRSIEQHGDYFFQYPHRYLFLAWCMKHDTPMMPVVPFLDHGQQAENYV
jgi:hypothetical protein